MKRLTRIVVFLMILFCTIPQSVLAAQLLIPGGQLIGLELSNDILTVAAFDDSCGTAAREAGVQIGDQLLAVDGREVTDAEEVRTALEHAGDTVKLTVLRGAKCMDLQVKLSRTEAGRRLGVYLRRGIAGVGTVTFYDPGTDTFGTLGHGVNDGRGKLLNMTEGLACEAAVASVKKGKSGAPGQLRGNAQLEKKLGKLTKNTPQGVFGTCTAGISGEPLPVAAYEDIAPGPATIRSTVCGEGVREYSVEIIKIYPEDRADCRNFLIKVTDPALLETTGGIVQGMGVSYNKDNQDNSLACRGVWC